jgi:hypothetical protein
MRPQTERYPQYRAPSPSWRIYRHWGGTKTFLGLVDAPDKVRAIQLAIRTFEITNPEHQNHLVAGVRD